jgi:large subunit ribosomal protein L2
MSRIKVYKPTNASRRKTSVIAYSEILTKGARPTKNLLVRKARTAGRNNTGKITVRHKGGGYKKLIRKVDFKRTFANGFKVNTVEYDPTRSAFVCLVTDLATGVKSYVLHTKGMKENDVFNTNTEIVDGNTLALSMVPVGTEVSQVELNPGEGAKIIRSAGNYAVVTAREEVYVTLKLPSGEVRKILASSTCVVGRVGNEANSLVRYGKAGRMRKMGIRPTVRGKVMNPVDHPHGGGEARNSIGHKYPKTPWGKHAIGVKTRNKRKGSTQLIIKRRKNKNNA